MDIGRGGFMTLVLAQHDGTPAGGWRCLAAALVGQATLDIASGNSGQRMTAWGFLRGPVGRLCCEVAGISPERWVQLVRERQAARRAGRREARTWPVGV